MATGVQSWSKTAATNASADSNVNWAEGMAPSAVNDSARAEMASVAKWRDDISGTVTTGGSSTAYTMTTNQGFASAAAVSGAMLTFIPHTTSGAAPTLAVDGLTARQIRSATGANIQTGALIAGTPYQVTYIHASTEFILMGYTEVFGNASVTGTFAVTGAVTFNGGGALGTGTYTGAATFSGNLVLSGTPNYTNVTKAMGIAGSTTANRSGSPTAGDARYNTTLNGLEYWNGTAWIVTGQAPTVQRFTSGTSQTYTPTAGVNRIRVRMVAGGGGGGAVATNNGSNGNSTQFGSWSVGAGNGGLAAGGAGGVGGGGGADGTGTLVVRVSGQRGTGGALTATAGTNPQSGTGGSSPFFGGGGGGSSTAGTGNAGVTNAGGGGAGGSNGNANTGGGGGGGEYVEFWVNGPTATTYTVGTGGNGGSAGTQAGGAGAAGIIVIEEFYS